MTADENTTVWSDADWAAVETDEWYEDEEEPAAPPVVVPTLRGAFEEMASSTMNHVDWAPRTRESYRNALSRLMAAHGSRPVTEVTPMDVADVSILGMSLHSLVIYRHALDLLFGYAHERYGTPPATEYTDGLPTWEDDRREYADRHGKEE